MKMKVLLLILILAAIAIAGCQRPRPAPPSAQDTVEASPTLLLATPAPTPTFTPTPPPALPTPTRLPTATPTPQAQEVEYVVQAGDTLFRISLQFNTTVEAIMARNPGVDPQNLRIGQVLIIPIGEVPTGEIIYVVQAGDNLFRIALRFNTTVEAIMEANGLEDTNIYVGQELIIPASDP